MYLTFFAFLANICAFYTILINYVLFHIFPFVAIVFVIIITFCCCCLDCAFNFSACSIGEFLLMFVSALFSAIIMIIARYPLFLQLLLLLLLPLFCANLTKLCLALDARRHYPADY